MIKRRLTTILKWQWWLHTAINSCFYIAAAFFFFFVLEDKLYEDQLTHIAQIVAQNDSIEHLPHHIQIHEMDELPDDWRNELTSVVLSRAIEVMTPEGVQVHLVRMAHANQAKQFALSLDTSKVESVWAISDRLLILLLPWMLLFLIGASWLSNRFIARIQHHFEQLLNAVKHSDSPESLEQLAKNQNIDELAQFAELFAQTWQQKLDILAREKQGLTYLSHELRTPLQSSIATLELLALKMPEQQNITRLTRSLNRMTRLSNTILCLMESTKPQTTSKIDVLPICQQLVDEIRLLAAGKNQDIVLIDKVQVEDDKASAAKVQVIATKEVVETILSILLTNALAHSNKAPIIVTLEPHQISIENEPLPPNSDSNFQSCQGFGIGLTIAQRLADKFNLSVSFVSDKAKALATMKLQ